MLPGGHIQLFTRIRPRILVQGKNICCIGTALKTVLLLVSMVILVVNLKIGSVSTITLTLREVQRAASRPARERYEIVIV